MGNELGNHSQINLLHMIMIIQKLVVHFSAHMHDAELMCLHSSKTCLPFETTALSVCNVIIAHLIAVKRYYFSRFKVHVSIFYNSKNIRIYFFVLFLKISCLILKTNAKIKVCL